MLGGLGDRGRFEPPYLPSLPGSGAAPQSCPWRGDRLPRKAVLEPKPALIGSELVGLVATAADVSRPPLGHRLDQGQGGQEPFDTHLEGTLDDTGRVAGVGRQRMR
jgi:hypothetical protein